MLISIQLPAWIKSLQGYKKGFTMILFSSVGISFLQLTIEIVNAGLVLPLGRVKQLAQETIRSPPL